MRRKIFCLGLAVLLMTIAAPGGASAKKHTECYPITNYKTVEEAVSNYKILSGSIVLLPAWLPFEATVDTMSIEVCGTNLNAEYTNGKHKIGINVSPEVKNIKSIEGERVSLEDGITAKYKENELHHTIRFNKEGRKYLVYMNKDLENLNKQEAIEYLAQMANSFRQV